MKRGFWFWFWVSFSSTVTVLVICAVSAGLAVLITRMQIASKEAAQAKAQSAQTAQEVADLKKPPFIGVSLKSLSINGGPPITDFEHTIFDYPCDKWSLSRPVVAARAGQVKIAKGWIGGKAGIVPAPEGAETFSAGLNTMRPVVQVPSNIERHQYLSYATSISMVGSLAAATIMQPIKVYILDPGEKKPKPGVYPPPRDTPIPPPRPGDPSCPVIVNPSPATP